MSKAASGNATLSKNVLIAALSLVNQYFVKNFCARMYEINDHNSAAERICQEIAIFFDIIVRYIAVHGA